MMGLISSTNSYKSEDYGNINVECPQCETVFRDQISMIMDSSHSYACHMQDSITYRQLWDYLSKLKGVSVEHHRIKIRNQTQFDLILIPAEAYKFCTIDLLDHPDIEIIIDETRKVHCMRISLVCKHCRRNDHFQPNPCNYIIDVCEFEKTLTKLLTELQLNIIPPCCCQRIQPTTEDDKECVICMDRDACIYFAPCKHIILCEKCMESYLEKWQDCPKCRRPIVRWVKLKT